MTSTNQPGLLTPAAASLTPGEYSLTLVAAAVLRGRVCVVCVCEIPGNIHTSAVSSSSVQLDSEGDFLQMSLGNSPVVALHGVSPLFIPSVNLI